MNENFTGARVVKAFGQEEQEMTRFGKNNNKVRDMALVYQRIILDIKSRGPLSCPT